MQSNHAFDRRFDLDGLLDRVNAQSKDYEAEAVPAPGQPGNEFIGTHRIVNGKKQFYAFSGAERRRLRRVHERDEAKERARGERAWNRQQRKQAFDAGTVRQQLRIITGELEVSPAMKANLESHIVRQAKLNERAFDSKPLGFAAANRAMGVNQRRASRFFAGKPRGKDLRMENFEANRHLLPLDYAGKGGRSA